MRSIFPAGLALILAGCASSAPLTSEQISGVSILSADHAAQTRCMTETLNSKIFSPSWKVISATPLSRGFVSQPKLGIHALFAPPKNVKGANLRFSTLTIKGLGYFGEEKTGRAVCIFDATNSALQFIQSCTVINMAGDAIQCTPAKFLIVG